MKQLVCIDAMIAIWGIKKRADKGQEYLIPVCTKLIADLDKEKKTILLPAPIITELLAPVDNITDRQQLLSDINLSCRPAVYDAIVAVETAKIWNENKERWQDLYVGSGPPNRIRFKYDLMILGTAIVNKVTCLYTGDKGLYNMAKNYLEAKYILEPTLLTGMQYPLLMPAAKPPAT